jgi:hypothetical protein
MRFYLCDNCYKVVLEPVYLMSEFEPNQHWCKNCHDEFIKALRGI